MRELPPGWATELAVLAHGGSTIDDQGDHLLVRTPANPDFHWGNCLFVTDDSMVDDAPRWVAAFRSAFPPADWVAIGLVQAPAAPGAWADEGLEVETDDVLTTRTLPRSAPLADGYTARRIDGDDWEQHVQRELRDNERTGDYEPALHERFVRARAADRRALSERGAAAFFGAFAGGELVADLGIVRCGRTARYQAVGTDPEHRRRGLASHLLGVAARWAADGDCDRWVIVTETTNPAYRVYRRLGFEPDGGNARAYRHPVEPAQP